MKVLFQFAVLLMTIPALWAQQPQPVKWSFDAEKTGEQEYELIFTADTDNGWYVYSQFLEEGGPIPTSFEFEAMENLELLGKTEEIGNKKEGFDELFDMNVIKFSGKTKFIQKVKVKNGAENVTGFLTFMTCNDRNCLPPRDIDFKIALK